jgi:hypothetical protein
MRQDVPVETLYYDTWQQEQEQRQRQGLARLREIGLPVTTQADEEGKCVPCEAVFSVLPNPIEGLVDLTVYLRFPNGEYMILDLDWETVRTLHDYL